MRLMLDETEWLTSQLVDTVLIDCAAYNWGATQRQLTDDHSVRLKEDLCGAGPSGKYWGRPTISVVAAVNTRSRRRNLKRPRPSRVPGQLVRKGWQYSRTQSLSDGNRSYLYRQFSQSWVRVLRCTGTLGRTSTTELRVNTASTLRTPRQFHVKMIAWLGANHGAAPTISPP
jgi:hypothetical protein